MNKHIFQGLVCGGIFASVITWVAASDAIAVGGFALLASAVFGLTAGLCIGGLIAANFVMMAVEEKEKREAVAHRTADGTSNGLNQRHRRSHGQCVRRECRNRVSFARSKWGGFHVMRDPPLSPVPFTNRLLKNLVAGGSKRPQRRGARR